MKVKEFDDFKPPRRRPWLLFVVVVAVLLIVAQRFRDKGEVDPEPEAAEQVEGSITPKADVSLPVRPILDSADGKELAARAQTLTGEGRLVEARQHYLAALERDLSATTRRSVEQGLAVVGVELVTTPTEMPEKELYVVKRGDSVEKIARRFGSTVDLVSLANRIKNPNLIKVGDQMRVLAGTFSIEVSKGRKDLVVRLNEEFFKRYAVGTGKFGKTPLGTYRVTDKIKKPTWWRPDGREIPFGDPENILGTRWMAIQATGDTPPVRGYGIHGTWDDASIGKAESAGCVRMLNPDVEEIFMLVPLGTAVTIVE